MDRDRHTLKELLATLPDRRATAIGCDVTNTEQMRAAIVGQSRLDVMVLNAGIEGTVAPITDYDENNFDQVMAVNVKGTWLGLKIDVAAMADTGGSIIVTSWVADLRGIARSSAYSASKHAVQGLVISVATEVGSKGLRITAVCPSPVEPKMMRSLE